MTEHQSDQLSSASPTPVRSWPQGPTKFELRFGNNVTRIVVGIVAIPLILAVVFLGGWWFFLLVAAMSTGALLEFYWMLEKREIYANKKSGVVAGIALLLPFAATDVRVLSSGITALIEGVQIPNRSEAIATSPVAFPWEFPFTVATVVLLVVAVLIMELRRDNQQALRNMMGTLAGICYVSFSMGTLLGINQLVADSAFGMIDRASDRFGAMHLASESLPWEIAGSVILVMLVGIWTCDSFAYFGGRAFGKHKLLERVSPKKTWEGAVSGALASVAICIALGSWGRALTWYDGLFIGIAAGVFGQIGDLVESHIKRGCGVKDSSQIIPGHGGILDRFDSLLFVAPLVYIYMSVVVYSLR